MAVTKPGRHRVMLQKARLMRFFQYPVPTPIVTPKTASFHLSPIIFPPVGAYDLPRRTLKPKIGFRTDERLDKTPALCVQAGWNTDRAGSPV